MGMGGQPEPLYQAAGMLRYRLGEYRRSLANFKAALAAQPENGPAYLGIGLAQRKLGNDAAAIVAFKNYLRLVPNAPEAAELTDWMRKHGG